jgi:hypothetical protein
VSFTPRPLSPPVRSYRRLGRPIRFGEQKNRFPLSGIEPLSSGSALQFHNMRHVHVVPYVWCPAVDGIWSSDRKD